MTRVSRNALKNEIHIAEISHTLQNTGTYVEIFSGYLWNLRFKVMNLFASLACLPLSRRRPLIESELWKRNQKTISTTTPTHASARARDVERRRRRRRLLRPFSSRNPSWVHPNSDRQISMKHLIQYMLTCLRLRICETRPKPQVDIMQLVYVCMQSY